MIIYYYYTNNKYPKLLVNEIQYLYNLYTTKYKVRKTDEKSLRYAIGNILFNCARAINCKQDTIVFIKRKQFFIDGIVVDGKRCKIKLSYTFFTKLLEILEDNDFITVLTGGNFIYKELTDSMGDIKKISTDQRTSSMFVLKDKIIDMLEGKVVQYEMSNLVVLRDEEKVDVEYKATELQLQQIDFLREYNKHIQRFEFKDKDGNVIAEPFLRRIFNMSWDRGGRFYCQLGVIQTMNSDDRSKITIDGHSVVEVDASALHPCILATKAGVNLDHDPYDFEVPAEIDYENINEFKIKYNRPNYNPIRNLNKICVLLALNNRTRGLAIASISKKLRDDAKIQEQDRLYFGISDVDINQLYVNMENRNQAIAENFGSNKGSWLQFLDSMWMERVLCYLMQQDIQAIPIHDSILCIEYDVEQVKHYMRLAYKQAFGDDYNLKLKIK